MGAASAIPNLCYSKKSTLYRGQGECNLNKLRKVYFCALAALKKPRVLYLSLFYLVYWTRKNQSLDEIRKRWFDFRTSREPMTTLQNIIVWSTVHLLKSRLEQQLTLSFYMLGMYSRLLLKTDLCLSIPDSYIRVHVHGTV